MEIQAVIDVFQNEITLVDGSFELQQRLLEEQARKLLDRIKLLGAKATTVIKNSKTDDPALFDAYVIHFLWAENAKSFLLLWRDSIFQHQKAWLFQQEGVVSEEKLVSFTQALEQTLNGALAKLLEDIPNSTESKLSSSNLKLLKTWKKQQDPWPIYVEQMETLVQQCQKLKLAGQDQALIQNVYANCSVLSVELIEGCTKSIEAACSKMEELIAWMEGTELIERTVLLNKLKKVEELFTDRALTQVYFNEIEKLLQSMPIKTTMTIELENGMLKVHDLEPKKRLQLWFESEIFPVLYELIDLTEDSHNGLRMALLNISNRLKLHAVNLPAEKELSETEKQDVIRLLKNSVESTGKIYVELKAVAQEILELIHNHLKLSLIYTAPNQYLPISFLSTVNQFGIKRNRFWPKVRNWFVRQRNNIQQLRGNLVEERNLSESEEIVRFIRSRRGNTENSHYINIFLTKGFVGEPFWVGRNRELKRVEDHIRDWEGGIRGAILLTGTRFSGKTLFGEVVGYKYFDNNVIRLVPNKQIELSGRKFNTKTNLKEAIEFITKHQPNEKTLILIDDVELWWDTDQSIQNCIRLLADFIDDYSTKFFFLVTTSNCFKSYLQRHHQIDRVFHAEINIDRIEYESLYQAILVRHGATHRKMVKQGSLEEISPNAMKRLVRKIYKAADGNIGDALNIWAYSTYSADEVHVYNGFNERYAFPTQLYGDTALLLSAMFMQKKTTEYRLRKHFGPSFPTRYAHILQRFMKIGLLFRHPDGRLELHSAVANTLATVLSQKGYLHKKL